MNLPPVSIIVPNYNGGPTLARTLQSLVDQQYPALQVIVVDGGSTDDSLKVIRAFASHLAWWVSEKDRGQSHAINKGFARCTGEVLNWLCSDDALCPGALLKVGQTFAEHPEVDVVVGATRMEYAPVPLSLRERGAAPSPPGEGASAALAPGHTAKAPWLFEPDLAQIRQMPCGRTAPQPSCFYRRRLIRRDTLVREDFHFAMDAELWTYFNSVGARWMRLPDTLAVAHQSATNKTTVGGRKITRELEKIYREYFPERISLMFWQRYLRDPLHGYLTRHPRGWQSWRLRRAFERLNRWLGRHYGQERVNVLDWRMYHRKD